MESERRIILFLTAIGILFSNLGSISCSSCSEDSSKLKAGFEKAIDTCNEKWKQDENLVYNTFPYNL